MVLIILLHVMMSVAESALPPFVLRANSFTHSIAVNNVRWPCKSFMINENELSFHEAQHMCKAYNYTGLAMLHTQEAIDIFLMAINGTNRPFDDYWVGLTSSDSPRHNLRWGNGFYSIVGNTTTLGCGKANGTGHIDAANCNECLKSVCSDYQDFKEIFSLMHDDEWQYSDAANICTSRGFDRLAVLDNEEKTTYILNQKRYATDRILMGHWIGMTATASNHLQWVTGVDVTWAEWNPMSEPDHLDYQKCVRISNVGVGTKECTNRKHAACEHIFVPRCPVHMIPNDMIIPVISVKRFTPKIHWYDRFPRHDADIISTQLARSLFDCITICASMSSRCRSSAYHEETQKCFSLSRHFDQSSAFDLRYKAKWIIAVKCG